ncbi:DUF4129 domain-containing transglutaminase family protein [Paenibacillus sp. NPDC058071]|uniref:DUF4129 domain-containing transglutaminase family protein n=1 Tax=Paenibacillus sp. NPDC058071 TaxID=3346326 RepID=UPI0036D78DBF
MHHDTDQASGSDLSFGYRLITSVLLFGLLAEWMLPWTDDSGLGAFYQLGPLLAIVGCMLGVGLFRPHWTVSGLIGVGLCLFSLMQLYRGEESALQWLVQLPSTLGSNIIDIFRYGLWTMSGELRTLLLFAGWALLAPALQALVWMRQLSLGLAALTVLYLTALHIWLGLDIMAGLMRTACEGLLLTGMVTISRVQRMSEGFREKALNAGGGRLIASCALVLLVAGSALLVSVGRSSEPEPPVWTAALAERVERSLLSLSNPGDQAIAAAESYGGDAAVTGYGFDDSKLGAALSQDESLVFTGLSPVKAYWRGESKSFYDGRGWSAGISRKTLKPIGIGESTGEETEQSSAASSSTGAKGAAIIQSVRLANPASGWPLFASGTDSKPLHIETAIPKRQLGTYVTDAYSEAAYATSETAKIERYTIESQLVSFDEKELKRSISARSTGGGRDEDGELGADASVYLQLPESLPSRVAALASEVAGGGVTSRYEQAKGIESYLKNNYAYSAETSKTPPPGADFVDHFLFEQKSGYCVHFSSAMVVMLRSQGIPARWVKGFVPGTETEPTAALLRGLSEEERAGMKAYEVRGTDAHAWVEAYFEGTGWVPFDPTPGFAGGVDAAAAAARTAAEMAAANVASRGTAVAALASGAAAPEGAVARLLGRRAQAQLEAAATLAASGVRRGANALAARAEAAAASPAAGAAAGAAALTLAAAAAAVAQRKRLRLALALRRYRAAYAELGSGVKGRQALAPLALVKQRFAAVSAATWQLLHRRIHARQAQQTAREYADVLTKSLPPARAAALVSFVAWDDAAKFGHRDDWVAPQPDELADVLRLLRSSKHKLH